MNRKQFFKWLGLGVIASAIPKVVESAPEPDAMAELDAYFNSEMYHKNKTNELRQIRAMEAYYKPHIIQCRVLSQELSCIAEFSEEMRIGLDIILPPKAVPMKHCYFRVLQRYIDTDTKAKFKYSIAPYDYIAKVVLFNEWFDVVVSGSTLSEE